MKKYYTVDEMAEHFGLHKDSIYYWIKTKKIHAIKRTVYLFEQDDLDKIEQNRLLCKNGHLQNEENIRQTSGKKRCRLCHNQQARNRWNKNHQRKSA